MLWASMPTETRRLFRLALFQQIENTGVKQTGMFVYYFPLQPSDAAGEGITHIIIFVSVRLASFLARFSPTITM